MLGARCKFIVVIRRGLLSVLVHVLQVASQHCTHSILASHTLLLLDFLPKASAMTLACPAFPARKHLTVPASTSTHAIRPAAVYSRCQHASNGCSSVSSPASTMTPKTRHRRCDPAGTDGREAPLLFTQNPPPPCPFECLLTCCGTGSVGVRPPLSVTRSSRGRVIIAARSNVG